VFASGANVRPIITVPGRARDQHVEQVSRRCCTVEIPSLYDPFRLYPYARGHTTAFHPNRAAMALPLKISVIVCAHNEARYLPACLHSVLAQGPRSNSGHQQCKHRSDISRGVGDPARRGGRRAAQRPGGRARDGAPPCVGRGFDLSRRRLPGIAHTRVIEVQSLDCRIRSHDIGVRVPHWELLPHEPDERGQTPSITRTGV